jgi:hypothetical protein
VVLIGTLAVGTWFYHHVEGWDWLDALYFCVITLATIGYGDLAPRTSLGKAFTIVFVFVGIGLLAATFSQLASSLITSEQQRLHPLRGGRRTGAAAPDTSNTAAHPNHAPAEPAARPLPSADDAPPHAGE